MGIANTPSNILHVHTLPVISGSGINTLLTMIGSRQRGHRVSLACESAGGLTREAEDAGIEICLEPSLGRELDPARDIDCVFRLAELMRRNRYDIVHTHNSKAGFVGRLAARLAGVPLVIHTVHGFAFHDAEAAGRRAFYRMLERMAAHWCDGLIFISKPLEVWAEREGIGVSVPRRVIYSGIDIESFRHASPARIRSEFAIPDDDLVVGIISKLWDGKGHNVLLKAWKQIQKEWRRPQRLRLLIVGEGPLDQSLRELARELEIDHSVVFTGFRADIPEITAAIDVAVLPSAFEGMGRVVLEAMAAGKPIVASNVGGIPDLVREGVTGLLVPPNSVDSLAGAISRLLHDEPLHRSMSAAAATALEREHSAAAMVEDIHDFYGLIAALKDRAIDGVPKPRSGDSLPAPDFSRGN